MALGTQSNSVIADGVSLLKVDTQGRTVAVLDAMHDDGVAGDAIAGDGFFTLQILVDEKSSTEWPLRSSAAFLRV